MKENKSYEKPEIKILSSEIESVMLPETMVVDPGIGVDDEAAKERDYEPFSEGKVNSLW